jgi:hypothetical protein
MSPTDAPWLMCAPGTVRIRSINMRPFNGSESTDR